MGRGLLSRSLARRAERRPRMDQRMHGVNRYPHRARRRMVRLGAIHAVDLQVVGRVGPLRQRDRFSRGADGIVMALDYLLRRGRDEGALDRRIEPRLGPAPVSPVSEVFDSGHKTIVDRAHVRVERLDTHPVLFSKVFKEFQDRAGQKYDYRYWSERENFFLREFLKKKNEFTHVVQARHLISENEAAKQVLTCDAGVTVANWLRVRARYSDTATLSNPFQRADAFLQLLRACLVALRQIHGHRIVHCDIKEDNICIPYLP